MFKVRRLGTVAGHFLWTSLHRLAEDSAALAAEADSNEVLSFCHSKCVSLCEPRSRGITAGSRLLASMLSGTIIAAVAPAPADAAAHVTVAATATANHNYSYNNYYYCSSTSVLHSHHLHCHCSGTSSTLLPRSASYATG